MRFGLSTSRGYARLRTGESPVFTMKWDSIIWDAELSDDENELRLSIEGACSDIDERTFRRLQEHGVEVDSISHKPEGVRKKRNWPS